MGRPMIFCFRGTGLDDRWNLNIYVRIGSARYWLFSTKYRMSVESALENGVSVDRAIGMGYDSKNPYVRNVCLRIPSYLRYVEEEEGITIMRKENRKKSFKAERRYERNNYEERLEPEAL